jgi:hypothetical protein
MQYSEKGEKGTTNNDDNDNDDARPNNNDVQSVLFASASHPSTVWPFCPLKQCLMTG